MSTKICVDKLQEGLRTKCLGHNIFFSREVGSTNEWAKKLAKLGASEGTVTLAETQTAGRGRLGREWVSPRGGLWFSVILRPKIKPAEAVKLVFVASLTVAEVLRELYGLKAETKWPNDVLIGGRKVCGILAEMDTVDNSVCFVVMGIGIDVNFDVGEFFPRELRNVATSIQNELGKKVKLESLFKALLERLEKIHEEFIENGFDLVLEKWKECADFLGHKVMIVDEGERLVGLALDVDGEGALVVKSEDGTLKRFFVGDASLQLEDKIRS